MENKNKIPVINDAASRKELDKMFTDLMDQKDDMDHSDNTPSKPTKKKTDIRYSSLE